MENYFSYLEKVAVALLVGEQLPPTYQWPGFELEVPGFVQPKERPRGANHYTPKATRVFEEKVRDAARAKMREEKALLIERPLLAHLEIRDQMGSKMVDWQKQLVYRRLIFEKTGGDLDNKTKAVLDALNGVVYRDDSQIVQLFVFRTFHEEAGFKLNLTPIGFTKSDLNIIAQLIKNGTRYEKKGA